MSIIKRILHYESELLELLYYSFRQSAQRFEWNRRYFYLVFDPATGTPTYQYLTRGQFILKEFLAGVTAVPRRVLDFLIHAKITVKDAAEQVVIESTTAILTAAFPEFQLPIVVLSAAAYVLVDIVFDVLYVKLAKTVAESASEAIDSPTEADGTLKFQISLSSETGDAPVSSSSLLTLFRDRENAPLDQFSF